MSKNNRWWTFAVVSVALFMGMLDNLVVTTALPAIQRAIGASVSDLEWVVNAYTLAFAVLMIPAAAFGERFGRRRVLLTGVAVFTIGSALAGLSTGTPLLIAARAIQGVGGAMVAPLTLTILVGVFPPERRAATIGLWSGVSGLGLATGPLIGGAIVNGLSWSAVFWVNVPIGILLLIAGRLKVPEHRSHGRLIDSTSVVLVGGGLLGIVFSLIRGNEVGWFHWSILGPLVAGLILIGLFVMRQKSHQSPMLDLQLFSSRPFLVANVIGFVSSLGMFGSIFFITLFVQGVWGWTPLAAGLGTMPWTGTIMLTAPLAGAAMSRFGARPIVVTGMAAQAAALLWIAQTATPESSYLSLLPAFIVGGLGMGLAFAPLSATAMSGLREERHGEASGAYNALREVGGVFGIAALGAVFQSVVGRPADFVAGFHATLHVASVVVAVGAVASLLLPGRHCSARSHSAPELAPGLIDTRPIG